MAKLCKHFGSCGGCSFQDLSQDTQLQQKQATLQELFQEVWSGEIPMVPSPEIHYYRNKVEFKFDRMQYAEPPAPDFVRETVLGFRQQGQWYHTFNVDECLIFSPEVPAILNAVRDWYRENDYRYYDNRKDEGLLKHLVLREARHTDDRMAILIVAHDDFDHQSFVDCLLEASSFSSIILGIQEGTGDVATADEIQILHGTDVLEENLHVDSQHLHFKISPFGFFQVNVKATELLYAEIRRMVKALQPDFLYDFYGGSGGIAFSCADLVNEILSVESFEPASIAGRENTALNQITNVAFETAPVEKWLGLAKQNKSFNSAATAILDPPRAAMHPKALRRIIELGPEHIIYVSCNPKLLARELVDFSESYEIVSLQAFDLFPHTKHIEVLCQLRKK